MTREQTESTSRGMRRLDLVRNLGGHPNPAISGQLKTGHFR